MYSLSLTENEQKIIEITEDDAAAILVVSKTGRATQLVNKFKPNKNVYGIS